MNYLREVVARSLVRDIAISMVAGGILGGGMAFLVILGYWWLRS